MSINMGFTEIGPYIIRIADIRSVQTVYDKPYRIVIVTGDSTFSYDCPNEKIYDSVLKSIRMALGIIMVISKEEVGL